MGKRPRVLLAEDHALVSQGLRALLQRDYNVVGTVEDGLAVPGAVVDQEPDVLLLDLSLPGRNGLDLIPDVRRLSPETRILIVTMHADWVLAQSALGVGAHGFIPKDCGVDELRTAITEVLAGRRYLSPRLVAQQQAHSSQARVVKSPGHDALWRLSPRQKEVLKGLGEGKTTAELADELGLSVYTVHHHRKRLRRVLGIETEEGLVRFAVMQLLGGGEPGEGALHVPPVPPTE
jgi:DNA-binding NarL/FixJ family response regulator